MSEKIILSQWRSFVPESEAKVSVLDSGFNAGDGVYDVTRTFAHQPFRLRDHTARLFRSLRYTRIDCGYRSEEMERATLEVLERNKPILAKDEEVAIWQVVSRGVRSSRGNHSLGKATVSDLLYFHRLRRVRPGLSRRREAGHSVDPADSAAVFGAQGEDQQQNESQHGDLRSARRSIPMPFR